jgi:hypothetical protein
MGGVTMRPELKRAGGATSGTALMWGEDLRWW